MTERPLIDRICIRVETSEGWKSLTLRESLESGHKVPVFEFIQERLHRFSDADMTPEAAEYLVQALPKQSYVCLIS